MIKFTKGNILQANVEAIVNTVNCVGFMGKGIALQFKKEWPENFIFYKKECDKKLVKPGEMLIFETKQLTNPRFIINFPTKRHWKSKSRFEDIDSGLLSLVNHIKRLNIKSIAIPPLGSGLGGLDWLIVKEKIEKSVSSLNDVSIFIYEPIETSELKFLNQKKHPRMTSGRAVLIELMNLYLSNSIKSFISVLELQKLLYFMQEVGEPLKLNYKKAHYGPYAENLRHVLNLIEGEFISGYLDGGDEPQKKLKIILSSKESAKKILKENPDTLMRLKRVSRLIKNFESPEGLEILATVHWAIKYGKVNNIDELIKYIYFWNERKRQLDKELILLSVKKFNEEGWLNIKKNTFTYELDKTNNQ